MIAGATLRAGEIEPGRWHGRGLGDDSIQALEGKRYTRIFCLFGRELAGL